MLWKEKNIKWIMSIVGLEDDSYYLFSFFIFGVFLGCVGGWHRGLRVREGVGQGRVKQGGMYIYAEHLSIYIVFDVHIV